MILFSKTWNVMEWFYHNNIIINIMCTSLLEFLAICKRKGLIEKQLLFNCLCLSLKSHKWYNTIPGKVDTFLQSILETIRKVYYGKYCLGDNGTLSMPCHPTLYYALSYTIIWWFVIKGEDRDIFFREVRETDMTQSSALSDRIGSEKGQRRILFTISHSECLYVFFAFELSLTSCSLSSVLHYFN